jgi:5-formyltetrahydrofolate cyclo-ligase
MNKAQLRKQFLSKRKNLSPNDLAKKSLAIKQLFFQYFNLHGIKKLHIFLPIVKQNEINTWLIIDEIKQNHPHITLIISKSHFKTNSMESYVLDNHTIIMETKRGIPEPVNAIKCPDNTIDMILIPLLCFDKQGFRVGYGKGFYDRFLQKCRQDIIKIGLSFFEPVDKINELNENDVKMDICIMNDGIWEW